MAFSARRKNQSFLSLFDYQEKERKVLECDNLFSKVKENSRVFFLKSSHYLLATLEVFVSVCAYIYRQREREKERERKKRSSYN